MVKDGAVVRAPPADGRARGLDGRAAAARDEPAAARRRRAQAAPPPRCSARSSPGTAPTRGRTRTGPSTRAWPHGRRSRTPRSSLRSAGCPLGADLIGGGEPNDEHVFDVSLGQAYALRTLSSADYRTAAASAYSALVKQFGSTAPCLLARQARDVQRVVARRGAAAAAAVLRPRHLGAARRARDTGDADRPPAQAPPPATAEEPSGAGVHGLIRSIQPGEPSPAEIRPAWSSRPMAGATRSPPRG